MHKVMEWVNDNRGTLVVLLLVLGVSLYALYTVDDVEDKLRVEYGVALQKCHDRVGELENPKMNLTFTGGLEWKNTKP